MNRFTRLRPSPAMVVALVALLVALGGTSFAAVKLSIPTNSVGTAQLKTGAVTSAKIADHTIRTVDVAGGQFPAGARGPTGAQGPAGSAGPGAKWALIGQGGNVIAQASGLNVTVQHPDTGQYFVNFGSPVTGHTVVATSVHRNDDHENRGNPDVSICGGGTEGSTCPSSDNPSTVWVLTWGPHNLAAFDHSFYIAVF